MVTTVKGKGSLGNMSSISSLVAQARGNPGKVLKEIPLDEISPKKQLRVRFTGIEELAQSLLSVGQQQPIVVSPKNSEGKYIIQKGERRYRAAVKAGLKSLDCIVREPNSSNAKELISEMAENIQRENYHPLEIAAGIELLINEHGYKKGDIASEMGKSPAYVTTHLKLLELNGECLQLVDDNIIRDVTALNYLADIQKIDPELASDLCAIARSKGLTRKQLEEYSKQSKAPGQPHASPGSQPKTAEFITENVIQSLSKTVDNGTNDDESDIDAGRKGSTNTIQIPTEQKPLAKAAETLILVTWKSPEGDVDATLDISKESDEEGRVAIILEFGSAIVEAESIQIKAIKRATV